MLHSEMAEVQQEASDGHIKREVQKRRDIEEIDRQIRALEVRQNSLLCNFLCDLFGCTIYFLPARPTMRYLPGDSRS